MSSFDMERLMQQAAQMQEQMARMQDEAEKETAQSSVGGGLVKVTANGAGQVVAIEISPDAIDPEDPGALADLILAGVNEALRSAQAGVDAKAQQMLGDMGLGGLGLPGLGEWALLAFGSLPSGGFSFPLLCFLLSPLLP